MASARRISGQFRLDRSLSPDARAVLQLVVERGYHEFLARVAEGASARLMRSTRSRAPRWSGAAALKIGLVDHLGTFQER